MEGALASTLQFQSKITSSLSESEYITLSQAQREGIPIIIPMKAIHNVLPVQINMPKFMQQGIIDMKHYHTEDQTANLLTKYLLKIYFSSHATDKVVGKK